MKTSELFALNQWLSDYPEYMAYDDVLAYLREHTWLGSDSEIVPWLVIPWFIVENHTGAQIAQFIDDTKESFEYFTKGKI